MVVLYRTRSPEWRTGTVVVKVFALREGLSCVVSWGLPEPGLRTFSPTAARPETVAEALPYAQFLGEVHGLAVVVELDDDVQWQDEWGQLREWVDG